MYKYHIMNNIILDDPQTSDSAFLQFINNPSTTKKYVTKGAGGFGWEIENNETTPYTSISPQGTLVKYTKVFLKIVPVSKSGSFSGILTTPSEDFISERDIQTTLFKRSNYQLDPICPPVVFSSILTNEQGQQLLTKINPRNVNSPTSMDFKNKPEVQMGIIAMGYTTKYRTLTETSRNAPIMIQNRYKYMAAYRLIQLYDMGYMHGDFSIANIVIDTDHIYPSIVSNEGSKPSVGHVLLIDFGATFKHNNPPDNEVSRVEKLHRMLNTNVSYLGNIQPINHANYKWLNRLIETTGDLENILINIEANVERYNKEMYENIRRTSPEIIAHIEKYNNSPSTISTVRGGMRRKNRRRVKRTNRASISRKKKRRKTRRKTRRVLKRR